LREKVALNAGRPDSRSIALLLKPSPLCCLRPGQ